MNITTKFNLNDSAWFMKDNKPIEVIISAIYVFECGTNQSRINYNAKDVIGSVSWLDHQNLFEGSLFRSKQELLNNLFGSDDKWCQGKNCLALNGVGHSEKCLAEHDKLCETAD